MAPEGPVAGLRSLQRKFLRVVVAVYVIVSFATFLVFFGSLNSITRRLGKEFSEQFVLKEKAVISAPIRRETTLARKMADTDLLKAWAENENEPELRKAAIAELEQYKKYFSDRSYFFVIHRSGNYYFNDGAGTYSGKELQYAVDRSSAADSWYFSTVEKVQDYALNVNYDKAVKETKIWINVVLRKNGKVLGLAGTGLSLENFIRDLIASAGNGVTPVLVSRDGAIQAHPRADLIDKSTISKDVSERSTVFRLVPAEADRSALRAAMEDLVRGGTEVRTLRLDFDDGGKICSAAYLPDIGWFILVLVDFRDILGVRDFLPIILMSAFSLAVLAALLLVALRRIVLGPLSVLTRYAQEFTAGQKVEALPVRSGDEIGSLTSAFNAMMSTIREYTEDLESKIRIRTEELRALFDNIGEGLLSFGPDFLVKPEYSRECEILFGRRIGGLRIDELLYPGDGPGAGLFKSALERFFATEDDYRRRILLDLLPAELGIGGRRIGVRFRNLESGEMMLVLSDVTYKKELEEKIAREQQTLRFVVNSLSNSGFFREITDSFAAFLERDAESVLASRKAPGDVVRELFRHVHTFKGLFLQMDSVYTPQVLHRCEERLGGLRDDPRAGLSLDVIRDALGTEEIAEAFRKDREILGKFFGKDGFFSRNMTALEPEDLARIESLAAKLLAAPGAVKSLGVEEELSVVRRLRSVRIFDLFSAFPSYTRELAEKSEKILRPFEVEGRNVRIARTRYEALAMSFIHVFRNAVVHGIEDPETRRRHGKEEAGTVSLRIDYEGGELVILAADDGRGIDLEAIRCLALEKGLLSSDDSGTIPQEILVNLLFRGGLSTRAEADMQAGRGFGLSALGAEVDRLGGRIEIRTAPSRGTEIRVSIPDSEVFV